MKLPNHRRLGTLATLAVLLAAMTTGCLTLCEAFLGVKPADGPDVSVTVPAGNTANNFATLGGFFSRFAVCDFPLAPNSVIPAGASTSVPGGVYVRTNRNLTGSEPVSSVDLVTTAATPPGVYVLQYRETGGSHVVGTLNLTVEAAEPSDVVACMAVFGEFEVIQVNTTTNFYGCCSTSPESDPIVQYKWWFSYNGNPSSPPSATTTTCMTTYTYPTPGPRTTRLVVRTESGEEAAETTEIVVQGL